MNLLRKGEKVPEEPVTSVNILQNYLRNEINVSMLLQARSTKLHFFLLLLVMVLRGASATRNIVQITSHESSLCANGSTCFTLPSCLLNATSCFTPNTIILFLPGDLDTGQVEQFVIVRGVDNIHLLGSVPGSNIHCKKKVGLAFFDVIDLSITRIQLHDCGRLLPMDLLSTAFGIGMTLQTIHVGWTNNSIYHTIPNTTFATSLFLGEVFDAQLTHLIVNGSRGFGLFCFNMLGQSSISDSRFSNSNINYDPSNCNEHSCVGGNVFLAFEDKSHYYPWFVFELKITNTHINHGFNVESLTLNSDQYSNLELTPSGGLTVIVLHQLLYTLRVTVNNSTIESNSGPQGANCALLLHDYPGNYVRINISNTYITNGNTERTAQFFGPTDAGGLYILYSLKDGKRSVLEGRNLSKNVVSVSNSTIAGNVAFYGAALLISLTGTDTTQTTKITILIKDSTITNNSGSNSVILVSGYITSIFREKNRRVAIYGTTIENNRPAFWSTENYPLETFTTTVYIQNPPCLCALINSTINNNSMQGLRIDDVRIMHFYLDNYVSGNTGTNGGGIQLHRSHVILHRSARLFIESNTAVKGGGLYIEYDQIDTTCFVVTNYLLDRFQIIFKNNTATSSGNSIYGHVRYCYTFATRELVMQTKSIIVPWNNSLTEVASDIRQLCFCVKGLPQCDIKNWKADMFPGKLLTVSSVAVGDLNGTVPGVATAYTTNDPFNDHQQEAQQLGTVCGNLQYRIYGQEQSLVRLYLQTSYEQTVRPTDVVVLTLSVTLNRCPTGFEQSNKTVRQRCHCITFLGSVGIACNIDDQSFRTTRQVWIGFHNETEQILAHESCPLGNCYSNNTNFTLTDTDLQCALGHSGILCGRCRDGLSAVFGSSRCMECPDSHIALLIAFLTAGIALVLVMIYCNLTLSKGTLNGLIFYANIVQVNRTVLFPQGQRNILTVFIAWLNLDLGIETCFYNEMDAYGRTWLQYLFPMYIWFITIFIIVASWYTTIAAKISGRNAVAVLATLLLLSYTKLQRTILESWSFTLIYTDSGSSFPVWLYDGNVPFFGAKHAVLFVAACVAAVAFILPFTFVILGEKLLLAKCGRVVTKFKLKPFLDVYQGAYNTKYRWWTGFMLLVRSALILAFTANVLGNPRLNLLLVIIACSGVMTFKWNLGRIYKQRIVNLVESFYLQNLILLALSTIYISHNSESPLISQEVASYILVGSAFLVFLITAGYHIFVQMKAFKNSPYWCVKKRASTSLPESLEELLNTPNEAGNDTAKLPTVSYVELRPTSQPERSKRNVQMRRESLIYSDDEFL